MAKVEGLEGLLQAFRRHIQKAKEASATSCKVGYTAAYALPVHENLEAHHEVGQAKFLEQPARENRAKYAARIADQAKKGRMLGQALLITGLDLQRDSQELCPVDKGFLKASAFTRLETS